MSSVAFSPDGRTSYRPAAAPWAWAPVRFHHDLDPTLRLWDAHTGQPLGTPLQGHSDDVWSVAFSRDGRRMVSAGRSGTPYLWPAPQAWPDELCLRLTRNMSRKEWHDWVSPDITYTCQCPGLPIPPDDLKSQAAPERCPVTPAQAMLP